MEEKLLFSKNHIWILQDGNTARMGISDYAQAKLKSIIFLNLPEAGDNLIAGRRFGDIESIKSVTDLVSPISGKVLKLNENVIDEPYLINADPYASWMVEAMITEISEDLMDEEAYKRRL